MIYFFKVLRRSTYLYCLAITISFVFIFPVIASAQENIELHEQEIKAGLLYNFLKYTDWPKPQLDKTPGVINVCVWGEDPFNGALNPMAGRSVNQRIITLHNINKPQDINTCNLIFISSSYKDSWSSLSRSLSNKNILTVSDFRGFANSGGMIEFGRKDDHINVLLNIEAVKKAGLDVSGRLLALVTLIGQREGN
jgi:hypothetical protein